MGDYDPQDQAERIKNYWNFGLPITDRELKTFTMGTTITVLAGIIFYCTLFALKSFGMM